MTTNPKLGETDAVTLPLVILLISNANADSGISNNPSPLPLKNPLPDGISIFPLAIKEPLNSEVTEPVPSTLKNPSVDKDAVTEPVVIRFERSASSTSAVLGISNKSLPEPLNTEPLTNLISPSNNEPLSTEVTLN